MKKEKHPQRSILLGYLAVIVILIALNMIFMPSILESQVEEVDYSTFMQMTEDKEIGSVEITSTQITFTNKDNTTDI